MQFSHVRQRTVRQVLATLALALTTCAAIAAADAARGIEQALAAVLQDQRGITIDVAGPAVGGAVTRIDPRTAWSASSKVDRSRRRETRRTPGSVARAECSSVASHAAACRVRVSRGAPKCFSCSVNKRNSKASR